MEIFVPSRSFLDKLLTRLKSGDARSIHLNALPGNFARVDIYDLANIDPSLHHKFLTTLLSQKEFSFPVHIDPQQIATKEGDTKKILQRLVKKLNHLFYQEKEELAEHGYTSFAFGYPLLIKRDPNNPARIIKAPIFIWYLQIEKDPRRNNTWILSRTEDQPVIFNEALHSHLETHEKIKCDEIEQAIEDTFVDENKLLACCRILSEQLNIPYDSEWSIATILPGTNKETIENLTKDHSWIRFSGIFGLYKTQKQSIIKDLESMISAPVFLNFNGHLADIEDLSPVQLDPSQEHILHALKNRNQLVIQGPPGTGKSQSLTGIITTALLNKKKILVVCEKRTALEVLYNNLAELGLQDLCVLIEDVYADRKNIVNRVRDMIENNENENKRMREIAYEEARTKFLSLQEEINHRLNFSRNLFFGDDTWQEIIILSVSLNLDESIAGAAKKLPKYISNASYSFSYPEFTAIEKELPLAEELYRQLDEPAETYSVLNDHFLEKNSLDHIANKLVSLQQETNTLFTSLVSNIPSKTYDRLKGPLVYMDRLLAYFSKDKKQLLLQQASDLEKMTRLRDELRASQIFTTELLPVVPQSQMQEIRHDLEKLNTLLNTLVANQNSFRHFYSWRKNWLSVPVNTRKVMNALKSSHAANWPAVFKCWYYAEYIRKTAIENGLVKPGQPFYSGLINADDALKQQLPARINYQWHVMQREMLAHKDLGQLKFLFNQRKNKQFETRNSLRKIVHADFELFSTIFPVVLVNPVVCTSVLPFEPGLFDLVILDEASQLKVEETYSSLYRGKSQIISGDKHQMPPASLFGSTVLFYQENDDADTVENFLAESHSLLEFANDAGYPNHYLDFHYRSLHPDLIRFSNAAFYNSRLVPMPEKASYTAVHYIPLDGIYNDGTNETEARHIVDYIYSMERSGNEYPSVGVATFNIFQRDLILDLLWEQAYADPTKLTKLEALLQKGLFIKNLENIQGDEREIMILSTTFGPDEQGKFRQLFGPLTQEKGYQLLNVIITRAKRSVYVYCSVPETVFMNYVDELHQKGNTGKAIFYAYLAYARACSANNKEQMKFILDTVSKTSKDKTTAPATSAENSFTKHVFDLLQPYFGDDIKYNFKFGGYILPVAIFKNGQIILSLETDEPASYSPEVNYRGKLHKEKILETRGVKTLHIWSYEWWLDPHSYRESISESLKDL